MSGQEIIKLERKANWVRRQTLEMCVRANTGFLASAFSSVEILVSLYYGGILRVDPENPLWPERDRFIMSKGHAISLYPILADQGFFPLHNLETFCQENCILGAIAENNIPGTEVVAGSLGHGLGLGSGMALAAKMNKEQYMTVVLLGDGECQEGSVWEAAMFAGHHQLNNLVAIVDRNFLGVTDFTENFLRLNPFAEKWQSFSWDATVIDGHSFPDILQALANFRSRKSEKPLVLIAQTTKGKGLSFMENIPLWHATSVSGKYIPLAREELQRKENELNRGTDHENC